MLKTIDYLPIGLALGAYKLPDNTKVIGTHAVTESKTGASGVLVRNSNTGIYSLFSCGILRSVDQREAKRFEA